MKRILAVSLALSLGVSALMGASSLNNSDPDLTLNANSDWMFCESPTPFQLPGFSCAQFKPGHEGYLMLLRPKKSDTTKWYVTLVGTRKDGGTFVWVNTVPRVDSPAGTTVVQITVGSPLTTWNINAIEDNQ